LANFNDLPSCMHFPRFVCGSWYGLGGPSRRSIQDGLQYNALPHVDGSPQVFLSLDFFGILPVFLVYLFKPQQTNVVVIRRFSPDLSVCTFPTDRCDLVFPACQTIGSHAVAISLPLPSVCRDRKLLILLSSWFHFIRAIPPADIPSFCLS